MPKAKKQATLPDLYLYKMLVMRVIDGDTVELCVDLGFEISRIETFRLAGIDAPEMSTKEGQDAKHFLMDLLDDYSGSLILDSTKDHKDKYGRYLATILVTIPGKSTINQMMVEGGHAKPYSGGKRE
jgi:micrococcal nuclease